MNTVPTEPAILAANTYFWNPATSAGCRRRNEARNLDKVASYLLSIGFTPVSENAESVTMEHAVGVKVTFSYRETCANVYKSVNVSRNGKNSNITAIRKIAATL